MKLNMLAIMTRPIYPLEDGYAVREYNLLKGLVNSWSISIIALSEYGKQTEKIGHLKEAFSEYVEIEAEFPEWDHLSDKTCKGLSRAIAQHCQSRRVDVIYVAGSYLIPYLSAYSRIPIVVDVVDDDSIRMFQKVRSAKNVFLKVKYLKWWFMVRRFLGRHLRQYGHLILTSTTDAASIKRICPKSEVYVIANGVDADHFKEEEFQEETTMPTLCFSGDMAFEPNYDAVVYFHEHMYPFIKNEVDDISLLVVGKNPSDELKKIAKDDSSVKLTGYVEDIRPFLAKGTVYISPMRMGSGVKNKILEAWAMSLPVVSTSLGCSGLDVVNGENVFLENDPRKFAERAISLLKDEQLRTRLKNNGRMTVESHYEWQVKSNELENVLKAASSSRG